MSWTFEKFMLQLKGTFAIGVPDALRIYLARKLLILRPSKEAVVATRY